MSDYLECIWKSSEFYQSQFINHNQNSSIIIYILTFGRERERDLYVDKSNVIPDYAIKSCWEMEL
jgi:hypothetical protein